MKNLNSIEYLRAFSMLYIVGYWHLFNYTNAFPGYNNAFTHGLTMIVLGLFITISGFLIGRTAIKSTSLIDFYRKRLIRIYPLYVLAVILFYIYGMNDAATSIKSMLFISMYYGPSPLTLWFITMLFLFYLATPFIIKLILNPVKFLLFIIAIFAITVVLQITFKTVDLRVLLYFPCFCVGIYCSQHGLKTRVVNIRSALLLFFFGLIVLFIEIDSWTLNQLKCIPIVLSSSYLVLTISYLYEDKFVKHKIISLLSYSSFAMYLFHRPIYVTLKSLYFPESGQLQVLYLITVCLILVAFISWGLQKSYDIAYIAVNKANPADGKKRHR